MSQFFGVEYINEFYGDHYLAAIAEADVAKVAERWKDLAGGPPTRRLEKLHRDFFTIHRDELAAERDLDRRNRSDADRPDRARREVLITSRGTPSAC